MKFFLQAIVLASIIILNNSCHSSQMVQRINDVEKLKTNEQLFIDKPLRTLLKEVKPKIKMVIADPDRADGAFGYFIFKFVDYKENFKYRPDGSRPISIRVFIKEKFVWDKSNESVAKRFKWTKADNKKYKNLTIGYITVFGNN